MKYYYINTSEDRVVLISKTRQEDLSPGVTEHIVQDTFDSTKEMDDGAGGTVSLDGFLTATEFLARHNSDYVAKRTQAYPSMEEQADMQFHDLVNGTTTWKDAIELVKNAHPKPV